jgi:hypothetical protein
MKNLNKSKAFSMAAGVALVLLQAMGNTACADYKGYWLDNVRSYQASNPRDYLPAPASYQDYRQEPVYQASQPETGYPYQYDAASAFTKQMPVGNQGS